MFSEEEDNDEFDYYNDHDNHEDQEDHDIDTSGHMEDTNSKTLNENTFDCYLTNVYK